ncbi:MAG: hypothetical protein KatS3mg013_0829 [Actinomycetota bacterium]|nr:MAG: hypothetical protein KatS3mg013_0829 [Actinomycetota bacterium]
MAVASIPGYAYGGVPPSPVTAEDLERLRASVLFTEEDERWLRRAGEVLEPQVDDVLDLWYGFVGSHPHLVRYFAGPDGQPDATYLARVRERFGRWILDTCTRPLDADWLAYAEEIGLRHHRTKKNQTDGVEAEPEVPLRYLIAFIYPITATIRDFLAKGGDAVEAVEAMHQAWFKSVVLQVALWSRPYAPEDW